jgi:hypothetical protein
LIERLPSPKGWTIPPSEGSPPLLSKERAYLECGCSAYVGIRTDRSPPEDALVTRACSVEHHPMMTDFIHRYVESLESPQDRPAVEVADEILAIAHEQASTET